VVALGDGSMSSHAFPRLAEIEAAVSLAPSQSARLQDLQVWRCTGDSQIEELDLSA
jgi:hypothetical protein